MTDMVRYQDLTDWENDLGRIGRELMPEARKVVSKGALNVKRGWARRWEGHSTIRHLPRSVNYDVDEGPSMVEAEIGPDLVRTQAPLAHIIEFGNVEYGTLRNAPIPGGQPALDEEEPRFVKAVADLAERILRGTR